MENFTMFQNPWNPVRIRAWWWFSFIDSLCFQSLKKGFLVYSYFWYIIIIIITKTEIRTGADRLPTAPNVTEESLMNTSQHTNTSIVKCCCGKQRKGLRGLKAHQRSCCTLFDLQKDILEGTEYNQSENNDVSDIDIENRINSLRDVKAGVEPDFHPHFSPIADASR